jgi:hypothetical protein
MAKNQQHRKRLDISIVVVIILGSSLGNLPVVIVSIALIALFFKIVTYVVGEGLLYLVLKNVCLAQILLSI